MRMSLILPVAAALAVAATGISSPASATTLKEALKICNKHGNCRVNNGSGGANIQIGTNEVYCPHGGGQCQCVVCIPPKHRIGPFGTIEVPGKVTPGEVLTSSSGGAGSWTSIGGVSVPRSGGTIAKTRHKPEPKPAPTTEPKQTPTAEPKQTPATPTRTTRDHRATPRTGDDRSSPGVTKTRYPYDIGKNDSGRKGPSEKRKPKIRDHRGVDTTSRTGPSEKRKPEIRDHRGVDTASRNGPSEKRKPEVRDHRASSAPQKSGGSSSSPCTPANRFCQRQ